MVEMEVEVDDDIPGGALLIPFPSLPFEGVTAKKVKRYK